jgi:ABC-type uncharacterized transport system substrate-binding protein
MDKQTDNNWTILFRKSVIGLSGFSYFTAIRKKANSIKIVKESKTLYIKN